MLVEKFERTFRQKANETTEQAHVDERTAAAFERFERADRNNDGLLTEQEIKRAHFDRLDKNGDGYVDAVELVNARRARGRGQAG